jgi:hypothetical protein
VACQISGQDWVSVAEGVKEILIGVGRGNSTALKP